MKHCPKCNKDLLNTFFYLRKKGPRAGRLYEKCKECMKIRGRSYYHNNHDRQLRLALIRRSRSYREKRDFIIKTKDIPCADCGIRYPFYVMDFDHIDEESKTREVSYMFTRNWSLAKITAEAEKCEVVCANCHRIRTYNKRQAKVAKVVKARV